MARQRNRKYFDPPAVPTGKPPADGTQLGEVRSPAAGPPPAGQEDLVQRQELAELHSRLRAARRELSETERAVGRERQHLLRVREALAAQRLALSAQDDQLALRQAGLADERAKLDGLAADLARQQAAMEADFSRRRDELESELGAVRGRLTAEIEQLTQKQAALEAIVRAGTRELDERAASQQSDLRQARERVERELAELRLAAEGQAEQVRRQADDDARLVRAETDRDVAELRERADGVAAGIRQAAEAQAAETVELARRQAGELIESARQQRQSEEEDAARARAQAEAELAERIAAADRARAEAEAELAEGRNALDHDMAAWRERQSRIEGELARIESEDGRLAQWQDRLAAEQRAQGNLSAELARRLEEVEAAERRAAAGRAELDRGTAELDGLSARLAQLDADLTARQAEIERERASLQDQQKALQQQHARLAEESAARLAELNRQASELAERIHAHAAREEELSAGAAELEQARVAFEVGVRELRRERDTLRQQPAELEQLGGDLAARKDGLVPSGQPPAREEAPQAAEDRPVQPAEAGPAMVHQALNRRVLGRWAASVAACTLAAVVITEVVLFWMAKPIYSATGQMHVSAADPAGTPAGELVLGEYVNFINETRRGESLSRSADSLVGDGWRAWVVSSGRSADSATMVIQARARTASWAVERVNRLTTDYHLWRERKLGAVRVFAPLSELHKQRRSLEQKVELLARTEQAARGDAVAQARLGAEIRHLPARQALAAADRRLGDEQGRLEQIEQSLGQLTVERIGWQGELNQLRPAVGSSPLSPTAERIERELALDRQLVEAHKSQLSELRRKAGEQLAAAQAEWTAAAAGLLEVLGRRDLRTDDPAVTAAGRRFQTAQLAYSECLGKADMEANPLARTLVEQIGDVSRRIEARRQEIAAWSALKANADRVGQLESMLAESKPRLEALKYQVLQLQAGLAELAGRRKALGELVDQLERAQAELNETLQRIGRAEGVSMARLSVAIVPAAVDSVANPRSKWMLLGGGIVFVVAAAAGWASLFVLARPGRGTWSPVVHAGGPAPGESGGAGAAESATSPGER